LEAFDRTRSAGVSLIVFGKLSLFEGASGHVLFERRPTSPISCQGGISFRRADTALAVE
jgi:hypothetical protein